jgi:putative CocE/NonD family hydrolase
VIEGVSIERDAECRTRDGTVLRADVYRPDGAGDGGLPVLLMRTPYDKTEAETSSGYAHPSWWARQGYVTVVQDCRGSFRSEGTFEPFVHEARDGYDAVEWAARLPGADGRVAMYGYSYVGATQLLAATERPPSLAAVAPGFTSSQYHEGWTFNGGALALAFAATWAAGLGYARALERHESAAAAELERAFTGLAWASALPLEEMPPLSRERAPWFHDWLAHPSYDDFWRATSIAEDYARVQVPGLHVAGWYDVFLSGSVENFTGLASLGRPQKLLIGPWHHGPWTPLPVGRPGGGEASARAVDEWQRRFLDQVLKGAETGVFDAPVTVFVLGDGWRDLDGWPPGGTRPVDLHLCSGGRANSVHGDGALEPNPQQGGPPDVFVYDPLAPTVSQGGHSCCVEGLTPMGPASQRETERWQTVLVYTSPPLAADAELLGDVEVELHAASSAVDTDFTARLCLVDPEGESVNLQEGIVRARYRDSPAEPTPIEPGRVYAYRIRLGPVGVLVPAGHRLRLDVASSDFPQWDRNLNTGGALGREGREAAVVATQAVYHDAARPSRVTLPVHGGELRFARG